MIPYILTVYLWVGTVPVQVYVYQLPSVHACINEKPYVVEFYKVNNPGSRVEGFCSPYGALK